MSYIKHTHITGRRTIDRFCEKENERMEETNSKCIVTNAILNTAKTVLGILFPLITYPYVSRVLGVKNLGIYTFSYSFLSYFLLLASLGVSTYGIREGTQYRDDKQKIESFVSELFSINILSTIVAYILLAVFLYAIPAMTPYRKVVLILCVEILFTTLGVSWVCNIYEDFLAIAVRTIAFQILSLVLILAFVRSSNDLYKYVSILLLSNSGANLVNYFYIRKKYCRFHFTLHIDWKKHLKPILIIFLTTVAITVYVSSDTTMLGFMTDDYQVGLYGTAVKIYTIIKNVLTAILMVLIPQFTLMFSRKNRKETDDLFSRVFSILTVLMLPMCVGLFSLSDDIVLLLFGTDYYESAAPLRLLSIAVAFSLYACLYTQCVLFPIKKEDIVFKATVISAIANIAMNFLLIPLWGINAAALTTIIAELITFAITFSYSRNSVSLVGVGKTLTSTILGCIGIFVTCLACRALDSLIIRILISVLGSVVVYLAVLLITRNPVLGQIRKMIFNRGRGSM